MPSAVSVHPGPGGGDAWLPARLTPSLICPSSRSAPPCSSFAAGPSCSPMLAPNARRSTMVDEVGAEQGGVKPRIRVGSRPSTIRALASAIDRRMLPDTYVTSGQLVYLERVSGVSLVAA